MLKNLNKLMMNYCSKKPGAHRWSQQRMNFYTVQVSLVQKSEVDSCSSINVWTCHYFLTTVYKLANSHADMKCLLGRLSLQTLGSRLQITGSLVRIMPQSFQTERCFIAHSPSIILIWLKYWWSEILMKRMSSPKPSISCECVHLEL